MKVYRISKWAFGGICLLILLLPLSRHWKLFLRGERTRGTVIRNALRYEEGKDHSTYPVEASEIEFQVEGITHKTYGPTNFEYEAGRRVTVFYNPKDPEVNCVATFSGVYLNDYAALPLILLMVWYAFYLSFNNYRKRIKKPKASLPKDPGPPGRTDHPFRRKPDLQKRHASAEGLPKGKRSPDPGDDN